MAGYTRADTTNQIANGQIADADILDAEYDAIQAAFSAGSGHAHGGLAGEGAPILVIGPVQDFVASASAFTPKSNGTYDLGVTGTRFRDAFLSRNLDVAGTITATTGLTLGATPITATGTELNILDGATVSTAELNLLDGVLSTTVEINYLQGVTSNVQTQLNQLASDIQDVVAGALEITGAASTVVTVDLTANRAVISSGTGKIAASGVTTTELNILDGATITTTELNRLSGVTSNVQTQLDNISNTAFPAGGIIIWSGSTAAIPSGWALCNGASGTPDLRGRMIIGAGGAYSVGATGGSASVTLSEANLPSHTHTFSGTTGAGGSHSHTGSTGAAGSHTHSATTDEPGGFDVNAAGFRYQSSNPGVNGFRNVNGVGDHTHTLSISAAADHTHSFSGTTSAVGSGTGFSILNPYYALAYIIKL